MVTCITGDNVICCICKKTDFIGDLVREKYKHKLNFMVGSINGDNAICINCEKKGLIREKYIHELNIMIDNLFNTQWYKYTMRRFERYYDQMQQNFKNIDDKIIFYNEWKDEKKQNDDMRDKSGKNN